MPEHLKKNHLYFNYIHIREDRTRTCDPLIPNQIDLLSVRSCCLSHEQKPLFFTYHSEQERIGHV